MRFSDRALIVGKTLSGKSSFARYLCAHFTGARVIIVNVKGRLDVGVPPVYDPGAIDWRQRVINFIPRSFGRDVFEDLYAAAWAHRGLPTVIWLDEAAAVTSASYAPDHLLVVQQQGGEWGVGHVVCAQRCKNVKMELRTEAEEIYIFVPPPSQADLAWLAEEMDLSVFDLRARLRDLVNEHGPHSFLRWTRATNELEDCAPLDPGWLSVPLHKVETTSRDLAPTSTPATAGRLEAPPSAVHVD